MWRWAWRPYQAMRNSRLAVTVRQRPEDINPGLCRRSCSELPFKTVKSKTTHAKQITSGDVYIYITMMCPHVCNFFSKTWIEQHVSTWSQLLMRFPLYIQPPAAIKPLHPKSSWSGQQRSGRSQLEYFTVPAWMFMDEHPEIRRIPVPNYLLGFFLAVLFRETWDAPLSK